MSAAVSELLAAAMSLPDESKSELVEAILECSAPSTSLISEQMSLISARMERVREGLSTPIPAAEAHKAVLAGLRLRA
jgi:hypothetical protein